MPVTAEVASSSLVVPAILEECPKHWTSDDSVLGIHKRRKSFSIFQYFPIKAFRELQKSHQSSVFLSYIVSFPSFGRGFDSHRRSILNLVAEPPMKTGRLLGGFIALMRRSVLDYTQVSRTISKFQSKSWRKDEIYEARSNIVCRRVPCRRCTRSG